MLKVPRLNVSPSFFSALLFSALVALTTTAPLSTAQAGYFNRRNTPVQTAVQDQEQSRLLQLQFPYVPDTAMTTGSVCSTQDSDFAEYRYQEKIPYCSRNVNSKQRAKIYAAYGVPKNCRNQYTIDHFIPLSIGGTNHPENLWPEHKSVKQLRQNLELQVFEAVRDGKMLQADAIDVIRDAKLNPPVSRPDPSSICH